MRHHVVGRLRLQTALAIASLLAGGEGVAAANGSPDAGDQTVYRIDWPIDVGVTLGAAATGAALELLAPRLVRNDTCTCRSADLPWFDRVAPGHDSRALLTGSDVLVAAALLAPYGLDAWELSQRRQWLGAFTSDAVVFSEVFALSLFATQVTKFAVQRPRPLLYDLSPEAMAQATPDAHLSFYSGHVSLAFASAGVYATTYALRHPDDRWWFVVAGGVTAGGAVATMRVLGGKHFPSDVAVGAIVGTSLGVAVPLLHRTAPRTRIAFAPSAAGGGLVVALGRF